jgi:hypothetical protein
LVFIRALARAHPVLARPARPAPFDPFFRVDRASSRARVASRVASCGAAPTGYSTRRARAAEYSSRRARRIRRIANPVWKILNRRVKLNIL